MKIEFTEFYQGEKVYPHAYNAGDVVELADDVAAEIVATGKAQEVKPARKSKEKTTDET